MNQGDDRRWATDARKAALGNVIEGAAGRLAQAGKFTAAARTSHRFREAVRRLTRKPVGSLTVRWAELKRSHRRLIADAYLNEVIRPKLGRPLSNQRNVQLWKQLTLGGAVDLATRARQTLDAEQLTIWLASDALHSEYLGQWALPILSSQAFELDTSAAGDHADDGLWGPKELRMAVDDLVAGRDPGEIATRGVDDVWQVFEALRERRGADTVDIDGEQDAAAEVVRQPPARQADPAVLQALLDGTAPTMVADSLAAVRDRLQQLTNVFADPAAVVIDELDAVTYDLDEAIETLWVTIEDVHDALAEVAGEDTGRPERLSGLFDRIEKVEPLIADQRETMLATGMLRRLAAVTARSDAAAEAAAALAEAAAAIERNDAVEHPLLAVVNLLDVPSDELDHATVYAETLPTLTQTLPAKLHRHLGLLTSGLLELPPPDLPPGRLVTAPALSGPAALGSGRIAAQPEREQGTATLEEREVATGDKTAADAGTPAATDSVHAPADEIGDLPADVELSVEDTEAECDGDTVDLPAAETDVSVRGDEDPRAGAPGPTGPDGEVADIRAPEGAAGLGQRTGTDSERDGPATSRTGEPVGQPDPDLGLSIRHATATGDEDGELIPAAPTAKETDGQPITAVAAATSVTASTNSATERAAPTVPRGKAATALDVQEQPAEAPDRLPAAVVDGALATTIAAGRWAAAYWSARIGGPPDRRATTVELAVYAMQLRRLDGPLTAPFADTFAQLGPFLDQVLSDPLERALLVASSIRAALVTPYASLTALALVTPHLRSSPAISTLIDTLAQAAQAGVRIGNDAPAYVRNGASSDEDPLAEFADQAAAMLREAPQQQTGFSAATDLWHEWMRSHKRLGSLLQVVVDGRSGQADELAAKAARTRKGLTAAIVADDRRRRGHLAERNAIQYTARMQLIHKASAVLDLIDAWAETVAAQTAPPAQGWSSQRLDALRDAITANRAGIRTDLTANCKDDSAARQVADAMADQLDAIFDGLCAGEPLRGVEPAPHVARNVALLKVDGLRLDTDTLEPLPTTLSAAELLDRLVVDRSWEEAFDKRARAGDNDETTAILHQIAADPDGGEQRAEQLAKQREQAMQEAQTRAEARWKQVRERLDAAQLQGVVDARTVAALNDQLATASLDRGRVDFGRLGRELDAIDRQLQTAREQAATLARNKLDEEAEHDEHVAAYADAVRERIDADDLAVARDLLLRLKRGQRPDQEQVYESEFNGRFSSAIADRGHARFDRAALTALRDGSRWGVVDYGPLSDAVRTRALAAGQAWVRMASNKSAVNPDNVAAVLAGIGLPVRNAQQAIETGRSGSVQHVWRQITVADEFTAPVPQFGTDTRGRVRLLITWDGISPAKLVNLAVEQGNRRPVVCLHLGTFPAAARRELAELCRPDQQNAQLVVIDNTLFGYRLSLNDDQWTATLRLALPYAAVNPYVPDAPELPREMFFGRRDELGQILDPRGTCVLYGGRKLGKSALMRQAERMFAAEGDHAVSVYLDVRNHNIGFGTKATADQLWPVLWQALTDEGIPLDQPAGPGPDDAHKVVHDGLLAWIGGDAQREVLILLDECDRLLDADAKANAVNPFPVVRGLYALAQESDRRIKPVFAGLHQVQRFQRLPNQPFAHLGRAIAIGGLDPKAAYDLIHQPLTALGCTFENRHVVSRVLAYTNYHPALLQVFGSELVRHVLAKPRHDDPPYLVTMADVDHVMHDERTEKAIRDKFVDTIALDPRYELIAYTLALHDHERGFGTSVSPAELRELCNQWHEGASRLLPSDDQAGETFRRLLDEMVDLGVLAPPVNGRYAMRSPVVTQLLGDEDRLLDRLESFSGTIETTIDPAHDRRLFASLSNRKAYPLTEQQLDALLQPADTVQLVLSSQALGGDDLDHALSEVAQRRRGHGGIDHRSFPALSRRAAAKLPRPKSDVHRLLVCDVREQTPEKLEHALTNGAALVSCVHPGSVTTLIHVGPDQLHIWHDATGGQLPFDGHQLPVTVLRRWTPDGIRLWTQRADLTLADRDIDRVVAATGGWPVLLHAAVDRLADSGSFMDAVETVTAQVQTAEGASRLVTQIGLDQLDETTVAMWKLLLDWTEDGPEDADELVRTLAAETGEPTRRRVEATARALAVLELLGVVVRNGQTIVAESVAAAAWRTATSQTAA
jgi:hypothetical protein